MTNMEVQIGDAAQLRSSHGHSQTELTNEYVRSVLTNTYAEDGRELTLKEYEQKAARLYARLRVVHGRSIPGIYTAWYVDACEEIKAREAARTQETPKYVFDFELPPSLPESESNTSFHELLVRASRERVVELPAFTDEFISNLVLDLNRATAPKRNTGADADSLNPSWLDEIAGRVHSSDGTINVGPFMSVPMALGEESDLKDTSSDENGLFSLRSWILRGCIKPHGPQFPTEADYIAAVEALVPLTDEEFITYKRTLEYIFRGAIAN